MSSKLVLLMLIGLALSACISTTPNWDRQFGESVRGATASQIIHPAAGANQDPVAGIDGKAALGAQQRYEHGFAQPQPPAVSIFRDVVGK